MLLMPRRHFAALRYAIDADYDAFRCHAAALLPLRHDIDTPLALLLSA